MQAVILSLALLAQDPTAAWATSLNHAEPRTVVEGTIELTPADADRAALDRARNLIGDGIRERAEQLAAAHRPAWLPRFATHGVIEDFVQRHAPRDLEIVDRRVATRDHGFGRSYQTTLVLVGPSLRDAEHAERWLRHRLAETGKLFLAKCGGAAVLWGFLAFLTSWLDRLSRGYMTWRLRSLALAFGGVATAIAFVL